MNLNNDAARGRLEQAKGSIKEAAGALVGDQTLEAKGAIQKHLGNPPTKGGDAEQNPVYKVVGIYPNFADVVEVLQVLRSAGFTDDHISLLGREQEHWQEKLGKEWEAHKTAKGALVGGALGAVPGLVLVAGVALTGGAGLLVAGPMVAAMSALGMGSLVGSLMGAGSNAVDVPLNVEEEVANAISLGQWVIIVQCDSDTAAAHAQGLLSARRVVWENKTKARTPADPGESAAAEKADVAKLAVIVKDAFSSVTNLSDRPVEDVMCNPEDTDSVQLKEGVKEPIRKISTATGLNPTQIVDIFREHRSSDVNIVDVLHERSKV